MNKQLNLGILLATFAAAIGLGIGTTTDAFAQNNCHTDENGVIVECTGGAGTPTLPDGFVGGSNTLNLFPEGPGTGGASSSGGYGGRDFTTGGSVTCTDVYDLGTCTGVGSQYADLFPKPDRP
jgi:hypothetical protein